MFLSAQSRRWRAFSDRDGATKRADEQGASEADDRAMAARDDAYDAYAQIQILGSRTVVTEALKYLRLLDKRNRAFKTAGKTPGVGSDERANVLATFVTAARKDVGLTALRSSDLDVKEGAVV